MVNESRKFDIRTLERYLRDDLVSREEYEEYMENLPDVSDKAEQMEAEFVEGVLTEEDDGEAQSEEEEDD